MSTLYLTTAERALYDKLPASVKGGVERVVDEDERMPNSDTMLLKRIAVARKSNLAKRRDVRDFLKKYEKVQELDQKFIKEIPSDVFPLILFMIGSRGISTLIEQFLQTSSSADHMQAIVSLSSIRHNLIVSDAVLYPS